VIKLEEKEILLPDVVINTDDGEIHEKQSSKMFMALKDVMNDADKSREEIMNFYGKGMDVKIEAFERAREAKKALFDEEIKTLLKMKKKIMLPKTKQEYVKRYFMTIDSFKKEMNQDWENFVKEINRDMEMAQKETERNDKQKLKAGGIVAGAHVVAEVASTAVSAAINKIPLPFKK
jgi:excinuclease UvrABC ATPase subunit